MTSVCPCGHHCHRHACICQSAVHPNAAPGQMTLLSCECRRLCKCAPRKGPHKHPQLNASSQSTMKKKILVPYQQPQQSLYYIHVSGDGHGDYSAKDPMCTLSDERWTARPLASLPLRTGMCRTLHGHSLGQPVPRASMRCTWKHYISARSLKGCGTPRRGCLRCRMTWKPSRICIR